MVVAAIHGPRAWWGDVAATWVAFAVSSIVVVAVVDAIRRRWSEIPRHALDSVVCLPVVALAFTPGDVFERNHPLPGSCLGCHLLIFPAVAVAVVVWRGVDRFLRRNPQIRRLDRPQPRQ